MIISAASDYRAAAQRILPPFLFHYIDGGAYAEHTLRRNVEDLSDVALRQRILRNMSDLSLETTLFNEKLAMPTALAPVGLCGMYARRGEVQAAGAVKGDITILADSGIRNGLDVVRMIALGADSVLLGRAYLYALATHGKQGVANLLNLIEKEMKVAMTLTGAKTIREISRDSLVQNAEALRTFDALKQNNAA